MRLSFIQIHRIFEAYRLKDESLLKKFRVVAYETWRKGSKTAPGIEEYMPIGQADEYFMTDEELDEIWEIYGKRRKN